MRFLNVTKQKIPNSKNRGLVLLRLVSLWFPFLPNDLSKKCPITYNFKANEGNLETFGQLETANIICHELVDFLPVTLYLSQTHIIQGFKTPSANKSDFFQARELWKNFFEVAKPQMKSVSVHHDARNLKILEGFRPSPEDSQIVKR